MNNWKRNRPRTLAEIESAILSKRSVNSRGCWEWTGAKRPKGYGRIHWDNHRNFAVHRIAAIIWLGMDKKESRYVCHSCDNPSCFNPVHLFIGTSKENQIDSVLKGRHFEAKKTHCKHGHEFTPENTRVTKSGRQCRTCHNDRCRKYRILEVR